MGKRKHVRMVKRPGMADKKFKTIFTISPAIKKSVMNRQHSVVASDLKNGSIESLGDYLKHHKGIPDRQVALELRKLISGNRCRTRLRLFVDDHPDLPKRVGGAPKKQSPTPREQSIVEDFEAAFEVEGKVYLATEAVMKKRRISEDVVKRARRSVKSAKEKAAERERKEQHAPSRPPLQQRHEQAMKHLRQEQRSDASE